MAPSGQLSKPKFELQLHNRDRPASGSNLRLGEKLPITSTKLRSPKMIKKQIFSCNPLKVKESQPFFQAECRGLKSQINLKFQYDLFGICDLLFDIF